MAGTAIQVYTTKITEGQRGFMSLSLTNWENDLEPVISEGSRVTIAGTCFKFDADEDVDPAARFAGYANDTQVYGYFIIAGDNVSCDLTTVAPQWEEEQQYFVDAATSTYRYWGGFYKDAAGNYTDKFIYSGRTLKYSSDFVIDERGNIDLSGVSNTDKSITFASDAAQSWDESEDYFNWNKHIHSDYGRRVTYSMSGAGPLTQDALYTLLSPSIPTTGKNILINATFTSTTPFNNRTQWYIVSYAERASSDELWLHSLNYDLSSQIGGYYYITDRQRAVFLVTDGSTAGIYDYKIAW